MSYRKDFRFIPESLTGKSFQILCTIRLGAETLFQYVLTYSNRFDVPFSYRSHLTVDYPANNSLPIDIATALYYPLSQAMSIGFSSKDEDSFKTPLAVFTRMRDTLKILSDIEFEKVCKRFSQTLNKAYPTLKESEKPIQSALQESEKHVSKNQSKATKQVKTAKPKVKTVKTVKKPLETVSVASTASELPSDSNEYFDSPKES